MVLPLLLALIAPAPSPATPDSLGAVRDSATVAPDTLAVPDSLARVHAAASAAPADTSLRVTGTRLRFGYEVTQAARAGDFTIVTTTLAQRGEVARAGDLRWFGLDARALLYFRGGRLARAGFEVAKPSPRDLAYVDDQLRAMGYKVKCARDEPGAKSCTWTGPTRVSLDSSPAKLTAMIEPAPRKPRPAPKPALPPPPEHLVLGRAGEHPEYPAAVLAASPAPAYPAAAKQAHVQGNVWVRAEVDTSGAVTDAQVVKSIPELDAAALAAVRTWRFERYLWNGRPARVSVDVPVRFVLH